MVIPLLTIALVSTSFDLAQVAFKRRRTLEHFGRKLLFFGIIVGMIGILFSTPMKQTYAEATLQINSDGIAAIQTSDITVTLKNWTIYSGAGQVYSNQWGTVVPEHSELQTQVTITEDGQSQVDSMSIFLYTNYGLMTEPLILHSFQGDVYLHLGITESVYNSLVQSLAGIGTIPSEISLTRSIVPMIYLLWIGVAIMCAGIALETIKYIHNR